MRSDRFQGIRRIARQVLAPLRGPKRMAPAEAFDLWSATYDEQTTNPLVLLDDELSDRLLAKQSVEGEVIVDVGCGSGRHWPKLLARHPARLIGYDVSAGMLALLRAKFPPAELHRVTDHRLLAMPDESCDLVISTLTLGYLVDVEAAFHEWARVLKPSGIVVVTDLHPAVATPNSRSFRHREQTIVINHRSLSLAFITAAAERSGFAVTQIERGLVGESVRPAYQAANALDLYRHQEGTALMFGLRLAKSVTR